MKKLCLTLFCLVVMIACSNENTVGTYQENSWLGNILSVGDTDDFLNGIDTINVRSVVMIQQTYDEPYNWDGSLSMSSSTDHEARAFIHPSVDSSVVLGSFTVNSTTLDTVNTAIMAWGSESVGLQTNFFSPLTNRLQKTADAVIGNIDTTLTFAERVRFSNFEVRDTIDLSSGRTFNLLGGANGTMQIAAIVTNPDNTNDVSTTVSRVFDGVSSYMLSGETLAPMIPGKGFVEIIKYEPRVVTTSNGVKIVFLGVTRHLVAAVFIP